LFTLEMLKEATQLPCDKHVPQGTKHTQMRLKKQESKQTMKY